MVCAALSPGLFLSAFPSQDSGVHYGLKALLAPTLFFSFGLSWVHAHSTTSCNSTLPCCASLGLLNFNEVTLQLLLLFVMPDIKARALCLWSIWSASIFHLNSWHFSEYCEMVTCNLLLPKDLKLPNGWTTGLLLPRDTVTWFNCIIFQECWLLGCFAWSHKASTTVNRGKQQCVYVGTTSYWSFSLSNQFLNNWQNPTWQSQWPGTISSRTSILTEEEIQIPEDFSKF